MPKTSSVLKTIAADSDCKLVANAAVEFVHFGLLLGCRLSPTHLADLLPGNLINHVPPAARALPLSQLWETLLELNRSSSESVKSSYRVEVWGFLAKMIRIPRQIGFLVNSNSYIDKSVDVFKLLSSRMVLLGCQSVTAWTNTWFQHVFH